MYINGGTDLASLDKNHPSIPCGGWSTLLSKEGASMNLIIRFVRFLAVLAFNVLWRLSALFLQLILLPVLLVILRAMSALIFFSFSATINGPMQYTDRVASEWTRRLLELGGLRGHIDHIFVFCQLIVGFLVALGWIVTVLFTVGILRVVFGHFI